MTSPTAVDTPTNEQIAYLLGWRTIRSKKTGTEQAASAAMVKALERHDAWEAVDTPPPPPDRVGHLSRVPYYRSDPATLGEAERYCRERQWVWSGAQRGDGAEFVLMAPGGLFRAEAPTLTEAWWTAVWRAAEYQRRASQAEEEA